MRAAGMSPGTDESRAVAACLRVVADAPDLPEVVDVAVAVPPVLRAWCRRVSGRNLWVVFRFDSEHVSALAVTRSPPVPIE
jgi:hypothetical protein